MTAGPAAAHPPGGERASATIGRAAVELAAAGVASPRVDAELLAAHVLGVPRARLLLVDSFPAEVAARYGTLVAARAARTPLQHLVGHAPFRQLGLAVGPGVFVPRPETELLAGWGLAAIAGLASPLVVDLCSGSGAIALAVAQEAPGARVVAVERSPRALEWLRRNVAARAAAGDRPVEVVAGDVTDPDLLYDLRGQVDLALCNPPYVPAAADVPAEVAGHDPAEAVFGGPDGLAVIRPVIALAARLLRPGGAVGVEHDDTHGDAVVDLLAADGRFVEVAAHPDLLGRPRFGAARLARGRLSW
ncbi:peptide chain release factor N(5)-glutamine methyltransferase [Pilimelia columellifera]|uniref:Release factor glutamine methyltransferase n=1 Tax=Pilimelia columellifera subsp. columellifera TaxID=706583 RepID=A0ABN3NH98_9ACTN